jgi:hypothetical protein
MTFYAQAVRHESCDACGSELTDDRVCAACEGRSDPAAGFTDHFLASTARFIELRRRLAEIAPDLEAWTRDPSLPWPGTPREHRDEIRAILAETEELAAAF